MAAKKINVSSVLNDRSCFRSCFILKHIICCLFSSLILVIPLKLIAEVNPKYQEDKVKAAYLLNFTKFIVWPKDDFTAHAQKSFSICILNQNPFGNSIELFKNELVNGLDLSIVISKSHDALEQCQIVYFPDYQNQNQNQNYVDILERLTGKNILTVSDIPGFVYKGGHIGLESINGNVRFNINLAATTLSDLKVSAKLLELAKTVVE